VLRSPYFYLGWLSEIEVSVSAGNQTGFADATGPVDLNGTAADSGFIGIALYWEGSWVVTKRACTDGTPCTISIEQRELKKFVHQYVAIDLVDNSAGATGWMVVHSVRVTYPSSGRPSTWIDQTGWLKGRACGMETWEGIGCDDQGSVTSVSLPGYVRPDYPMTGNLSLVDWSGLGNLTLLDLGENELNGTVTDPQMELNLPKGLSTLRLGGNKLYGDLPSIRKLWYLERLNMSSNFLSGEIPDHWFLSPYAVDMYGMPTDRYGSPYALKYVNMSFNAVTGALPGGLSRHSTLEVLDLHNNQLTGTIPSPLGIPIRHLDLGVNSLSGVAPLRVEGWASGLTDSSGQTYGLGIDGYVDLSNNGLIGLVPDWIKYVRDWKLYSNSWCCPLPSWTLYAPPFDAPGRDPSLAWSRDSSEQRTALTCTSIPLSAHPSVFGVCPTIAGPCDGSVWCGHQQCKCDEQAGAVVGASQNARCPGYRACGCDMRRLRCIYRPEKQTWCNSTHNGICIDEGHEMDYTTHPALNPYYGDTESNRYHG